MGRLQKRKIIFTLRPMIYTQSLTRCQSYYNFHAFQMAWLMLMTITKDISGNINLCILMNRFLILPACITSALITFQYLFQDIYI